MIFENVILGDHPFRLKIGREKLRNTSDMLSTAQSYLILEEKLNTRFFNPASAETNSSHLTMKEFHRRKDESDRGVQGQ